MRLISLIHLEAISIFQTERIRSPILQLLRLKVSMFLKNTYNFLTLRRRDIFLFGIEACTLANHNNIKVKNQGHLNISVLMSFHIHFV